MKKAAALLLVFVYLLSTSGMSMAAHYCGSKLKSFSITGKHAHNCKCSSKKSKARGCCSSKKVVWQVKNDQKTQQGTATLKPASRELPDYVCTGVTIPVQALAGSAAVAHAPPDKENTPLLLHICTLRI